MFDTVYDEARLRICELVGRLSPDQLAIRVPATPEWSARQLVAHVAGVAADAVRGRTEGMPGPAWTAAQVAERNGWTIDEIVAEWARTGPGVCEGLTERRISVRIALDLTTHEADLREALGMGPLPAEVVDAALRVLVKGVLRDAAQDRALVVRAGGREWRGGEGEPVATVTVEPYELYRGLMSRRSRAQLRAWAWSGDAEAFVDALPVFGPRDDDQPGPG